MNIGSEILWQERPYALVGVDPMSVPGRRAYLRDSETGDVVEVPLAELLAGTDADGEPG